MDLMGMASLNVKNMDLGMEGDPKVNTSLVERPSEYGSGDRTLNMGLVGIPQVEEYGSGYGRRPESEASEYGSGYEEPTKYGSGYGRKSETEYGSGYEKPSEYGRTAEYGSGYGRRPGSENEGDGSEYGRKESCGEEGEGYGGRSRYEKPIYRDDSPKRSSHGRQEGGGEFGRPSHGSRRSDDDDEDRRSKYRDGGEEGHGRKKYVGFSRNFQLIMLYGFLCNVRSFSVHGNVGFCVAFAFVMF
ncbi:hypothetical protein OIU79_022249 [Salix purpurea]|uniref:Glycine-rich protein n=1 Tax=Salix purpurea TaxID=77065 RepID=A0A9Q0WFI5_SALPP|nr:hypothetical protein OIU79_022249 [Salix purpurea]